MKLVSWNTRHCATHAERQAEALLARQPEVVALQEVTHRSWPVLRDALARGGLSHAICSLPASPLHSDTSRARTYGVAVISRFPLAVAPGGLCLPWPEKGLSVIARTPRGAVEVHTVHVPPGTSHGWLKIEVFESIYVSLARPSAAERILCGDFNSPAAELESGEVICWGKRLGSNGQWRALRSIRGRPAERWHAAESSVIVGLRPFGLRDIFRELHGFGRREFSIEMRHRSTVTRRRFDHLFASPGLSPTTCEYLHPLREAGLSDHAPIEAAFLDPP